MLESTAYPVFGETTTTMTTTTIITTTTTTTTTTNGPCGSWIGNGYCNDMTNNIQCEWDGGECCGDNVIVNAWHCTLCECLDPTYGSTTTTIITTTTTTATTTTTTTTTTNVPGNMLKFSKFINFNLHKFLSFLSGVCTMDWQ